MTANRTIVEIHILQTMPPSNLNRDDTGSPKKAVYGGVTRARVSSQAWKRPTRLKFRELVDPNQLGIRTKRVVEVLTDRILRLDPAIDPETAQKAAQSVLQDAGGFTHQTLELILETKRIFHVHDPYLLFRSRFQTVHISHRRYPEKMTQS